MIKSITIDFTSLNLYRTCPQKFAYRILQSLGHGDESPALSFGKLAHYGIEQLNRLAASPDPAAYPELEYLAERNQPDLTKLGLVGALNLVANEAATSPLFRVLSDERRSLRHLLLLLVKYCEHWNPDALRTSNLEVKHKAYLGITRSGVQVFYSGTLDGLCGGKIIERKTTSYLNAGFINRINPNAQATGYIYLARDLYKDPALNTVIFDAISTGGYGRQGAIANPSRWLINTEPAKLFLRTETYRTDAQLEEWRAQTLADCDRLIEDISRGRFSTNQPDACTAFNSTCPFIDICRADPSQRPTIIDNTTTTELWDSFQINQDFVS